MPDESPEKSVFYQVEIGPPPNRFHGPLSPLQRLKFAFMALIGLAVIFAFLSTALFIGLLLAVPLSLLWMFWIARAAWHMRRHSRTGF